MPPNTPTSSAVRSYQHMLEQSLRKKYGKDFKPFADHFRKKMIAAVLMADAVSREVTGQHDVPAPDVRLTPFATDMISAAEWIEKVTAIKKFKFVTENPTGFDVREKGIRLTPDMAQVVSEN